jgi:hypothetical protein
MRMNQLALAVSGCYMNAAEVEDGAAGDDPKDKLAQYAEEGIKAAKAMIEQEEGVQRTLLEMSIYVAKLPEHDHAVAWVDGFVDYAEKQQKVGTKEHRAAAKQAAQNASRFNRVIRSVWGTNVGGKKHKPGIGLKETLAILTAKTGGIREKFAKLPSSGEGRKPQSAEVAVQRRVTVAADAVAVPGMDTLSKALNIKPSKVDKAENVAKAAQIGAVQVIKMLPESMLNDGIAALCDRLQQSPDPFYQNLGKDFADHWTKAAVVDVHPVGAKGKHLPPAVAAKVEAGAEAK